MKTKHAKSHQADPYRRTALRGAGGPHRSVFFVGHPFHTSRCRSAVTRCTSTSAGIGRPCVAAFIRLSIYWILSSIVDICHFYLILLCFSDLLHCFLRVQHVLKCLRSLSTYSVNSECRVIHPIFYSSTLHWCQRLHIYFCLHWMQRQQSSVVIHESCC